ncbi:MAG: protein disulfide oxidoreductase [Methylococcaceae bacterium]|nr:protein disulfide oxidoreductase [Methylococcaceae bacterium]
MKSLLSWIAVLVMVFAIQLYASSGMIDGGKAPELQGLLVNGKPFARLDTLPKPALIYFWASWCGICRAMQSTVTELARDFPLITVATQSGDGANVREYMAVHQFEVQTLLDPEGGLGKTYGIRGVPALFIVDRLDNIRFATTGYTSALGLRLRLWLAGR